MNQLGVYEKAMPNTMTIEDKLMEAKIAGFDFMEISIDETDEKLCRLDWSKSERKKIIDAIYKNSIPIKTMCLSGNRKYPIGSNDKVVAAKGVNIIKKAIDFADEIGIRIIQIAGYDVYYEESSNITIERFKENLIKCVEYASTRGVYLGFETMETEFMNTVKKAMEYVKLINSPYLNVYPDIGNLTNAAKLYSLDIGQDILAGKGRILAAHLKETMPDKFREIPFGTGHVNFNKVIYKLQQIGVHIFTAEFWHNSKNDFRFELKKVHDFLRNKL